MEGWWKDGRRVCEDRARILKQNSQYQVKLSQLSQFGGSQAKMRWSDVMGSGEVLNSTKKSIENPRITHRWFFP